MSTQTKIQIRPHIISNLSKNKFKFVHEKKYNMEK